jgi:tetratricopeptide (TPR) repeat protein
MTSQLMEDWLSKQGAVLPEHKALLEKALTFYEEFAADTGQDEATRAGIAAAHLRVGNMRNRLGLREAAETAYISARQLFTQLIADFPTVPAYRKGLADSNYEFGLMLHRWSQRPKEVEEGYRASLTLRQQLATEFPTVPAYRFDLAFSHVKLGDMLRSMNRLEEAEQAFRAALNLREQLAREFPTVPRYRVEVAGSHIDLATLLQRSGRLKEAEENMRGAPAVYQQYAADFPTAQNRWFLSWAYNRQGGLLGGLARLKEAEEAYRAGLAIDQQLVAEFPTVVLYRQSLKGAHHNLGNILREQGRLDEAVTQVREAIRLDKDDFLAHYLLGKILRDKGHLDESIAEYRAAVRSYRVFEDEPKLINTPNHDLRYNAACAAALAGCGQEDADKLDAKECARLRQQALDWLRADLKAHRQMMEKAADKVGPTIARLMQHWLQDEDFAGVRGDKALAKLPDEEQSAWRKLWADVAEMLAKAQGKAPPEKKPDTK